MATTADPANRTSPIPSVLGRRILGPTALGSSPRRFAHLVWTMATTDFKLRFFGSALGYLWQLMRPLMLFGVLYVMFALVLKVGDGIALFPAALLMGVVLWGFVNESVSGSVVCLLQRENLVRKIEFPRLAVPLAVILTALMNLGLALVAVFVFLMAAGGSVMWTWIELPFLLLALALFCTGLSMFVAPGFVRYRDVAPISDVVLQAGFYVAPIFFPYQLVYEQSPTVAHLMMLNPFALILEQARYAVIDHQDYPNAIEALGHPWLILVPIGITVLLLVFGFRYFSREAPKIAERL